MLRIVISYERNTTSAHTGLGMWPRLIECGRARLPFRVNFWLKELSESDFDCTHPTSTLRCT